MERNELIKTLRHCGSNKGCYKCPLKGKGPDACMKMLLEAANALEAQDKALDERARQLAELSAKVPKEGECEAKKPKTVKDTECSFYCDCPTCGGRLISNVDGEWCAGSFDRVCRMCGQKIDWSEYCGWSNKPNCGAMNRGEQI